MSACEFDQDWNDVRLAASVIVRQAGGFQSVSEIGFAELERKRCRLHPRAGRPVRRCPNGDRAENRPGGKFEHVNVFGAFAIMEKTHA